MLTKLFFYLFLNVYSLVAYEIGNSSLGSSYSGSDAATWAVNCIPGCSECPECTSSTCSCGCTYFTTHAMVHGGAPNGYEGTCSTLWKNFKNGKYAGWKSKGTNANSILPGDAVIMNNGHDGDASHCCIGTSKGLISCHNPSHANVPPSSTWYSGGYINDIWGVSTSSGNAIAQDKCASTGYFCGNNGLGLEPNNLYYCSEEGGSPVLKSTCSFTCVSMPENKDDVCASSGSCSESMTGSFCGSNKINGDPDTLYFCDDSSRPHGAIKCPNECHKSESTQPFAHDICL